MLSLPGQFCRSSQLLQAVGNWAQFSPSGGSPKEGGSVWATIITGAQSPAALPAPCGPHSPLHSCTRLALIYHLAFTLLINPQGALSSGKSHPQSLLVGRAAACVRSLPSTSLLLLKKVSVGTTAAQSHCLAFHTPQLSGKSRISVMASRPPLLLVPGAARILPLSGTVLACDSPQLRCAACHVCVCRLFYPLPSRPYAFKSLLQQVCHFPALSATQFSSNVVPMAAAISGAIPGDLPVCV